MPHKNLLNLTHFGEQTGTPLLMVHGLFGSSRNWRAIARFLSKDRWVVTVDLRNHGNSFWDEDNTYPALASDLAKVIDEVGGTADVMGHSMGGKAAMVLAVENPQLINRLIIADIAPVEYKHTQSDNVSIMQSIPIEQLDRRSDLQSAIEKKTGDAGLAAFFAQSLSFENDTPKWQLNLQALQDNMKSIIGFPTLKGNYQKEALFLRGGASDYVIDTTKIDQLFPQAIVKTIDGAGHWLHAEKPREFMQILSEYLSQ
jgi:pimeloyl-ACP methyl ester carboxylesterase